jgi:hypothetical protein
MHDNTVHVLAVTAQQLQQASHGCKGSRQLPGLLLLTRLLPCCHPLLLLLLLLHCSM